MVWKHQKTSSVNWIVQVSPIYNQGIILVGKNAIPGVIFIRYMDNLQEIVTTRMIGFNRYCLAQLVAPGQDFGESMDYLPNDREDP